MGLEKLIPRPYSFVPGGLYWNVKRDLLKQIQKKGTLNREPLDGVKELKFSKKWGKVYEGIRAGATITTALIAGTPEIVIMYAISTYIIDRVNGEDMQWLGGGM